MAAVPKVNRHVAEQQIEIQQGWGMACGTVRRINASVATVVSGSRASIPELQAERIPALPTRRPERKPDQEQQKQGLSKRGIELDAQLGG
jgi:hypothetical protein